MAFPDLLAVIGLTLVALAGGIFWSFSTGVMPGLRRVDDATFVTSMRAINRAVLNPLFLVPIFVAPLLLAWAALLDLHSRGGGLLLAAAVTYFLGGVVVTMAGNVPLNTALDGSSAPPSQTRAAFERRWNALNTIRSVASVLAIALAALGLVAS